MRFFQQYISAVLHRIFLIHLQLQAQLPFKDNSEKILAKSWVGTLILLAKAFLSSSFPFTCLTNFFIRIKFLMSLSWSGSMTYLIKPTIHNQVNSFNSISICNSAAVLQTVISSISCLRNKVLKLICTERFVNCEITTAISNLSKILGMYVY